MPEELGTTQYETFDRVLSGLKGLPDVVEAGPSTIRAVDFYNKAQTFIVSTIRQTEKGDTIFLEGLSESGSFRLVVPPKVAEVLARQRDQLTTKVRRKVGRRTAEARKLRGELPGFMKGKRKGKEG